MTVGIISKRNQRAAIGRLADPEDIANMITFLAAEESSYLTAAEFVVDGGGTSTGTA